MTKQDINHIKIDDFDYELPEERIAKYPSPERDKCKLLIRDKSGRMATRSFAEIIDYLDENNILVYNNTKVINARLHFRKGLDAKGAQIEIFCLEPASPIDYEQNFASRGICSWKCFVGNSKRWKDDILVKKIKLQNNSEINLAAKRLLKEGSSSVVEFSWDDPNITFSEIISAIGELPIPPYLNRSTENSDLNDYQTVYSHIEGSVAAPTAGLHFTDNLLQKISEKGIERKELTLHVGAGTFLPVKSDYISEHEMHSEFISVEKELIKELAETDKKVVAVGTTSVRTLESLYHIGCMIAADEWNGSVEQWYPYSENHPNITTRESLLAIVKYLEEKGIDKLIASTKIIIIPGYKFRIVKGMVTNFHQPRSTLLLLVSAFINGQWRNIYDYALAHEYKFLSYGDSSLLLTY